MKKSILLLFSFIITFLNAQNKTKIEIPETYELSNIVLALTKYGISDEWEVQKRTDYYNKVLDYFQTVKNHPLLDSVNYSREKWEDFLSFRTDAVAFSFDEKGNLKRDYEFYANEGHKPFDQNLDLVNDFVKKSNFREFYAQNKPFYDRIVRNYEEYNYINESIKFLDKIFDKKDVNSSDSEYLVILSPLVYRMNCHRKLSENITADFPSATEDFVNGVEKNTNIEERLHSNHLIFTEKDHEYVNPLTNIYLNIVNSSFDTQFWDKNSGYEDHNSFNEYLTWAIYDLFVAENFPKYSKRVSMQWKYQNMTRGFIAQNIFSDKLLELYNKSKSKKIEDIIKPLLKWTKEVGKTITLPTFLNTDKKNFVKTNLNNITIEFSEPMKMKSSIGAEIREYKDGKETGNKEFINIENLKWLNNGKKMNFKIDTKFKEFILVFNWWGIDNPLVSQKGIFLEPLSYIMLKK
ncbi:DUF4932 domain-containing protein [Riemerella anatipestifer]|uniref:DUF4932 domain-containing protein n=1 Tax=Riemerella anatipestifer TaxID=34085 RepID=UPI0012AE9D0A|nr:DUF4932 domain-containing protein [Riemerella anatipestifer]USL95989.1 DUF4932 domain-containing protein [Riemerella anatipestifer]